MKKYIILFVILVAVSIGITRLLILEDHSSRRECSRRLKMAVLQLNKVLDDEYKETGKTAADYENTETLVNDLFKKRMDINERKTKFTNKICQSDNVFETKDGIIYCFTKDFYVDKNDKEKGACNIYNFIPCNKDGSKDTVSIYIDVNGEKGPNKQSTYYAKPCQASYDENGPIVDCTVPTGKVNDIFGLVLYSQKISPSEPYTASVMFNRF